MSFTNHSTVPGYKAAIATLEALSAEPLVRDTTAAGDRLRFMLGALGVLDPAPVIHVVGTSGKGSTATFLATCLRAAGYRTGLFTGPHLIEYGERMVIDGRPLTDVEVLEGLQRLFPVVDDMRRTQVRGRPTVLEVLTAVALAHFAGRTDVIVLEAGMGGARDCTIAVPAVLTVLTRIGLDHEDVLGPTLADITREKATAIRPGIPVVLAPQVPEVHVALAPLVTVDVSTALRPELLHSGLDGVVFRCSPALPYRLSMVGRHQMDNAATAVAALQLLGHIRPSLKVSDSHVRAGLEQARLPGRLQIVAREPWLILDGAHNVDGALALHRFLRDVGPPRPLHLLMGVLADKNRTALLETLLPLADGVHVTLPATPRAGPWDAWWSQVQALRPDAQAHRSIGEALSACQKCGAAMRVVAGSLYLVGEALHALEVCP